MAVLQGPPLPYYVPINIITQIFNSHPPWTSLCWRLHQLVSSGQCGCLDHDLTQGGDYEVIYDSMMGLSDVIGDFDESTKRQVVEAFCDSTMSIGDNLQVSSINNLPGLDMYPCS